MRKFEKISVEQFKKDISLDNNLYESYILPKRNTRCSAGYDFASLIDYELLPGEIVTVPTGVKVALNADEVLFIFIRSSLGFKYNIRLVNQVGVIDADYYNNESNEGHIMLKMQNEGNKPFKIEVGSRIAQGVITKFLTIDNEDEINEERKGGFGSTDGK